MLKRDRVAQRGVAPGLLAKRPIGADGFGSLVEHVVKQDRTRRDYPRDWHRVPEIRLVALRDFHEPVSFGIDVEILSLDGGAFLRFVIEEEKQVHRRFGAEGRRDAVGDGAVLVAVQRRIGKRHQLRERLVDEDGHLVRGCLGRAVGAGHGNQECLRPFDIGIVRNVDRQGRVARGRRERERPRFRRVVLTCDGRAVGGSPLDRHVLLDRLAQARREGGCADVFLDARGAQDHRRKIDHSGLLRTCRDRSPWKQKSDWKEP